ncbi:serine/threonine-protein phosphatase [Nocardioides seonyuensis]|uniref:Serine/threonine-protein phosphatase n=1 Tax=Nocardioides seonyuensis TaxID=2518371 RepID=A0A4P7ID92_9ACTN|nr:PP2C family protein-serine/threonine phosphatase [Nocardioides seonyuensis]QBX55114.1 serine/threonine-protein phosphatase [Nocardioides seonyuensis]
MVSVRGVDFGRLLAAAESQSPVEAVEAVARELGAAFDAAAVSFHVADLSGRALVRLAHVPLVESRDDSGTPWGPGERRDLEESATVLPFGGGPSEQAVRTQTVQVLEPDPARAQDGAHGWWRMLAPVTERGESIGLLEVHVAEDPGSEMVAQVGQVAHLLAFVVIANERHTDLYEWGQRSRSFSLSAEIQQRLLPGPRTCEASAFTLAGWLEPAASIGGDTFDYSVDRDVLHMSLTDAMGHGVGAALTASVCLGSLRGARRSGMTLLEQATETNVALSGQARTQDIDDFVTGLLVRVDLRTGAAEVVNAGHVAPYLARGGDVTALELPVDLPLGLFPDSHYRGTVIGLRPGDRMVLVTDGMLERAVGAVDLLHTIGTTRELHPREVVRALADSALEATGHQLSDDATILCLDWHGTHDEDRSAVSGADPGRASDSLA